MKKDTNQSTTVRFVLCIGEEMFARDSFLAYRPNPEEKFPVLGITFTCINLKGKDPAEGEPVIGELCSSKSRESVRAVLIDNSFMQLSVEEVAELTACYLTAAPEPEPVG